MNVEFDNEELRELYRGKSKKKPKYSLTVIKQYQKVINYIRGAKNFKKLKEIKSLRIKKLEGENYSSMRINMKYRLLFQYEKETITIIILKISKHYEN